MRRRTIAAIAMAAAATFTLGACADQIGSDKTGQQVGAGQEDTPATTASEDEGGSVDPVPSPDFKKDVTIKSCRVGDPYHLGDKKIVVDVSVKNSMKVVADYLYEIEATKANGDRIEMMYGDTTKVSPGQTIDTNSSSDIGAWGEEDVLSTDDNVTGLAKCQVVSVDATPSTE